ncbi:haloacid dehalogenase hydrolase domain-containing protein [Trifolium repens]|nr:haloacid dehalogenase hydrolase domain-containing protein [Trifolium repens]
MSPHANQQITTPIHRSTNIIIKFKYDDDSSKKRVILCNNLSKKRPTMIPATEMMIAAAVMMISAEDFVGEESGEVSLAHEGFNLSQNHKIRKGSKHTLEVLSQRTISGDRSKMYLLGTTHRTADWKTERYKDIIKSGSVKPRPGVLRLMDEARDAVR